MDGTSHMKPNSLEITVSARVDDPSWLGEVESSSLSDEAVLFTDIYLGALEYRDRNEWRVVSVPAAGLAVVGHLLALARLLIAGADGRLHTYQNEWSMGVRHQGESVLLEPNWDEPLTVNARVLRIAASSASLATVRFIRAVSSGDLHEGVELLDQLGQSLTTP